MKAPAFRGAASAAAAALVLALPGVAARAQPAERAAAGRTPPQLLLRGAARVGDPVLARQRGGTDSGDSTLIKGSVSDNQAVNVTTGGNVIADGAFAGVSGVPVVIQNSGNNVLIQSSTTVVVNVK